MMTIPIYQIDAFAGSLFSGNPAAVCPLEDWIEDSLLQAIAQENNLSETAFFVPKRNGYHIRWFTPAAEVDLCGHATLASAFVIFTRLDRTATLAEFDSKSGKLVVAKDDDLLTMDFPSQPPSPCETPLGLVEALGREPSAVFRSEDYLALFQNETDILELEPDFDKLKSLDLRGLIVTAPGNEADFVSRFFAPKVGIREDPVTGSAHCALTPFWANRLRKKKLFARQVSGRGGEIFCTDLGERVHIAGRAVLFMEGKISL